MSEFNPKPLSGKDREVYPNAIFTAETASLTDFSLMAASFQAMQKAGYPIVFDFEKLHNSPVTKITIRTDNKERKELRAFSALYQGLQEATLLRSDATPPSTHQEAETYYQLACQTSSELLADFLAQPAVVERFNEYYSGLRWHSDQEKIVRTLFEFGTDFDEHAIENDMSSSLLTKVAYALDIPYERQRKWYEQDPNTILLQNPDIDYHQLRDPAFAQSKNGRTLLLAYSQAYGDELARVFQNGGVHVSKTGEIIARPLIPLSRFPVIEALICSEMQNDGPRAKYDLGPSSLFDVIPYTDSAYAHKSLVSLITTRLPKERKPGIYHEGQDEFTHKANAMWAILRAYREYEHEDGIRQQLVADLMGIADAYEFDGTIAASVRDEFRESLRKWPDHPETRDAHSVRSMVSNLLATMLASSDKELFGKASQIVSRSLEAGTALAREVDPTILSRSDLMLVCIDTVKNVTGNMQTAAFGRIVASVFESPETGSRFKRFAEMRKRIDVLRKQPNVRQAWMEFRKHSFHIGAEDPAHTEARVNYDIELQPANTLSEQLQGERNQFLIDVLNSALDSKDQAVLNAFRDFVGKIEIFNYHMRSLPREYFALMELAEHQNINTDQRNAILWHVAEQWKHLDGDSAYILVPVVLQFYKIVLGDPGHIQMPDRYTSIGLGAASYLVHNNRGLFKSASQEQLEIFIAYEAGIKRFAAMVAGNEFLTDGNQTHDIVTAKQSGEGSDTYKWQREQLWEIKHCADEIGQVADHYRQYLRNEAIKVKPNLFYPWMLEQLAPFWQQVQADISPGNDPSSMMQRLYSFLRDYIQNRLIIHEGEYPESFDCLTEGHLGDFLRGLYPFLNDHDLNYHNSVYHQGQSFRFMVLRFMPKGLAQQVIAESPGDSVSKSLAEELKRRETEEADTIL